LFGATAAGLLVAVAALTLLTWPVPIEEFRVSIDVLGYVALGGICVALLLLHVLMFYEKWKDMLALLPETRRTVASDLV
jgi:hypothetical protein